MMPVSLKEYLVLDKIKDGSVGTVWRAMNSSRKIFALKQLALKFASEGRKVRQFEKEAKITQKLDHPNIIKVHEYADAKPQPFFVMEYFDSENLKYSMLHLTERVHTREFHILMHVADALRYVHAQGIVHKDVKPENVLISPKSDVRLIDFSLAQTKWDRMLQFGRRVEGTPMYMAPEQIRGEKVDARADIYSFGVMMYELLTKRPPFLADSPEKLLHKHVHESPPPLRRFAPHVAPELDSFVIRLLAKPPAARYPDMDAVMRELTRWINKDTVVRLRQVVAAPLRYPKEVPSTA